MIHDKYRFYMKIIMIIIMIPAFLLILWGSNWKVFLGIFLLLWANNISMGLTK